VFGRRDEVRPSTGSVVPWPPTGERPGVEDTSQQAIGFLPCCKSALVAVVVSDTVLCDGAE
jgi:hypothetical protein